MTAQSWRFLTVYLYTVRQCKSLKSGNVNVRHRSTRDWFPAVPSSKLPNSSKPDLIRQAKGQTESMGNVRTRPCSKVHVNQQSTLFPSQRRLRGREHLQSVTTKLELIRLYGGHHRLCLVELIPQTCLLYWHICEQLCSLPFACLVHFYPSSAHQHADAMHAIASSCIIRHKCRRCN